MTNDAPASVGLGGDGDEIAAILDVEREFGVILDKADAPNWGTAGDVHASLIRALGTDATADPVIWDRFAAALAMETGVDPGTIMPESPLLAPHTPWGWVAAAGAILFIAIGIALIDMLLLR
ncbi:hypothetical protein P1X14_18185 [Sphingomonas sp. AOB5]|uniref:hypothetical protein n=1 Tax=Sphingomonas sp. AOB5 TaxID=3034017 RepID=UPI0023F89FF8|nr:hypothetical protein [Sphingomonas sp. AOB5]MDF7777194.1 hypothetical protein [Sphingomonas sp. AOB5]